MSIQKSSIPTSLGQKSHRNLGATSLGTTDFGRLDVLYHTPINPGEDLKLKLKGVLQAAPMVVNTFGKFRYDVRAFFVPNRILCHRPEEGPSNFVWDYFIQNLTAVQHPFITYGQFCYTLNDVSDLSSLEKQDLRRLMSQFRYPSKLVNSTSLFSSQDAYQSTKISPFPWLAYQRIWWDFYRNPNWIDESLLSTYIPYPVPGGSQGYAGQYKHWFTPRYACYDKDYFTNAMPFGSFSGAAGVATAASLDDSTYQFNTLNTNKQEVVNNVGTIYDGQAVLANQGIYGVPAAWMRSAMAIDHYLTRMALVGTRVRDRLKARFGIPAKYEFKNSAQYLGGRSQEFTIGSMTTNADTFDTTNYQPTNAFNLGQSSNDGRLSGQRTGTLDQGFGFDTINFHSEEYGILMVIGTLIPDTGYYQGQYKDLSLGCSSSINDQRQDYLTPELANIGVQLIRQREIFGDTPGNNDNPWGWTERYGSYAYQPNVVDGDMILQSTYQGMDSFHLFREFSSAPVPGNAFCTITPQERMNLDRIFQIANSGTGQTFDHFNRFTIVDCDIVRALAPSWLPELYEDNNHGNTVTVDVGGSRF